LIRHFILNPLGGVNHWHFPSALFIMVIVSDNSKDKENKNSADDAASSESSKTKPSGRALSDETRQWFSSLENVLEYILKHQGDEQASLFVDNLTDRLREAGLKIPESTTTPYLNTISVEDEPAYPGDWRIETRI
jgi:pyruvate dehydrogenase E1 component